MRLNREIRSNVAFLEEINAAISVSADEGATLIRQQDQTTPRKVNPSTADQAAGIHSENTQYDLPIPSPQGVPIDEYDDIILMGTSTTARRSGSSLLDTVTVEVLKPRNNNISIWEYGIRTDGIATMGDYPTPLNEPLFRYIKGEDLLVNVKQCSANGLLIANLVNVGLESQGLHVESASSIRRLQQVGNEKFGLQGVKLSPGMRTIIPRVNR